MRGDGERDDGRREMERETRKDEVTSSGKEMREDEGRQQEMRGDNRR